MVDERRPDGTRIRMGQRLRAFESGDTPHENNYSADGSRIFHASIGRVYTPGDHGPPDPDAPTTSSTTRSRPTAGCEVVRNRDFDDHPALGHGPRARGGRPPRHEQRRTSGGAHARRDASMYLQVSFFHGIVEFALDEARRRRQRGLRPSGGDRAGARGRAGHPAHPAADRARSRTCRASSTSWTRPTTARDQRERHASSAWPARCRTTPRSSTARTVDARSSSGRRPLPRATASTPSPTGPPRGRATPAGCR